MRNVFSAPCKQGRQPFPPFVGENLSPPTLRGGERKAENTKGALIEGAVNAVD